jgi:hypothetical protein
MDFQNNNLGKSNIGFLNIKDGLTTDIKPSGLETQTIIIIGSVCGGVALIIIIVIIVVCILKKNKEEKEAKMKAEMEHATQLEIHINQNIEKVSTGLNPINQNPNNSQLDLTTNRVIDNTSDVIEMHNRQEGLINNSNIVIEQAKIEVIKDFNEKLNKVDENEDHHYENPNENIQDIINRNLKLLQEKRIDDNHIPTEASQNKDKLSNSVNIKLEMNENIADFTNDARSRPNDSFYYENEDLENVNNDFRSSNLENQNMFQIKLKNAG